MQLQPCGSVFRIAKWAIPLRARPLLVGERIRNDSQDIGLSGVVLARD
jgi:hypothetical protein